MKRRSKVGGKAPKSPHGNTRKPKQSGISRQAAPRTSSTLGQVADVQQLIHERDEALEQQAATSDLLQLISSSPSELQPVFAAIIEKATRLCEAAYGTLWLYENNGQMRMAALHGQLPGAFRGKWGVGTLHRPSSSVPTARAFETRKPVQIKDLKKERAYIERDPLAVASVDIGGIRSLIAVPMLKDGKTVVGAITIYRQEVRPFTDKQIALVANFATQAVIAIENARLLNELRQRTDDLSQRTADLTEALEQQTATSDVLKVISSSPGELQPVFDTMLANATRLCEAAHGHVWTFDGEQMHAVAVRGDVSFVKWLQDHNPVRPIPGSAAERIVGGERLVHVTDRRQEPAYRDNQTFRGLVDTSGIRASLSVGLRKGDTLLGMINVYRQEVRPFTDEQIELVKNFAAQAVIAIENARLLNELRQRTNDLTEALEQQTATSEVLQVISSSPGDLEPVFAAMLASATRICEAKFGNLFLREEETFRAVAWHGIAAYVEKWQREPLIIKTDDPHIPLARLVETKLPVHVADLRREAAYKAGFAPLVMLVDRGGARTLLIVPMLKEHALIGAIAIYRQEVRPFTDKQIALVENFAAQAVIAIENARLLNELRQRTTDLTERTADLTEALEQQTATSEILQVISGSLGDLEPVFASMLENAVRICEAKFGNVYRAEGDGLRSVATHNTPTVFAEALRSSPYFSPGPKNPVRRMIKTKTVVHVVDVAATEAYAEREPITVASVELGNTRTLMIVPMLKDNELIGAFTLARKEVRPFTDKQIELVRHFAAQAVIAIENARLLAELRQRTTDLTERTADLTEALEQQTATSEVLQVISSSPSDLEPVFASMLEKAVRICDAAFGNIYRWDGDALHLVATRNTPPAFAEARRYSLSKRPGPKTVTGRMLASKTVVHVADAAAEPGYGDKSDPDAVAAVELGNVRTILAVPMWKEDELIGSFTVYRQEVRPFTDKQIALVTNFAAQAVIAIENARLLTELRERTEEVETLNEQLEQRVADQVGEIERMGRLRRFLPPQVADLIVASGTEKQLESHRREITALFCDLRGFTGFTESADAEDVMALLRDYHAAIGEIIIKYSGTLERYAGDGVMVVFNDPVPVDNPALQAVLTALEMRDAIGALTEKWRRLGHDIGFGIGIAHGFATLGTIGFEGRFDYAAIGTVSNVASRLCDEAKPGQILISPRVLMAVEDTVTVEPVGEFALKGIRRPLAAYNVLAQAG